MNKIDIKSYSLDELQTLFIEMGLQKFRAVQVYKWIVSGVESFSQMTNLSKDLREKLDESCVIANCKIALKQQSKIDGTVKYLFELDDKEYIEAVLMKYHHGNTICISTQVGCKMNCSFCATGKQGFTRNLLPSEMLSQISTAQIDSGERISNVVLMGMGEPFDNFQNVVKFLKLVSSSDNINIGMRHISVSTCGLVDKIYELADMKMQITLSISLHAPNDNIRNLTMPVNKSYNIDKLITACKYYTQKTGRRICFEYAMLHSVNDSPENALELAKKLKGMLCHINLIPVNEVAETSYKKSLKKAIYDFIYILEKNGLSATVRRTLGSDIDASCGQLRGKNLGKES